MRSLIPARSRAASAGVTPCLSRPMPRSPNGPRRVGVEVWSTGHAAARMPASSSRPGGSTPMTVWLTPSSERVRPAAVRTPPSRSAASRAETTTTGGASGALVARLDETPGGRPGAERGKEAGRDPGGRDLLRLAATRQRGDTHARRAEGIEAPLLLPNRLDVHHRERPAVVRRVLLIHPHQPVGVGIRQVTQQHRAHHAEHRGGGTNGQREHHDRGGGEAGIAPEAAEGEAHVGGEIVERAHAARVERGLAPLLDAAEREQGLPAGRRGVGAGPDARGLVLLEVKADLLVQIALPPAAEDQCPEPLQEVGDHRSASRTRRIPSTAAAVRRQTAVSASSWRRPLAVSA